MMPDPIVWARFPDLLADVTGTLVDLSRTDPDAEPLRDRPARQRLRALVHALAAGADAARRQPGPVRRMADVLGGDASFAVESAHLATALLWPGPTFADDLARRGIASVAELVGLAHRDPVAATTVPDDVPPTDAGEHP